MKVLYIHSVPQFGGASRSLYEMVAALREIGVEPFFVASSGTVGKYFDAVANGSVYARKITAFNNTRTGYYKGVRWLVPLRELISLPGTFLAFRRAKSDFPDIDLIHVNELIDLPAALIAGLYFKVPFVIHLRTSFRGTPPSIRARGILWGLKKCASAIIAIDENTKSTLPAELDVDVIHNSLHVRENTDTPLAAVHSEAARPLVLGYVGNLLYSKGIIVLLKAVAELRKQGRDVRLEVFGGGISAARGLKKKIILSLGLSDDASEAVMTLVDVCNLHDHVQLHGHVDDLGAVYPKIDVLVFPSIFDSPGRPIFEAAFYGVPSIACLSQPKPDTFIDGETGIAINAADLDELVSAITVFHQRREEIVRMGKNARELALTNFDPSKNATKVLNLYTRVLDTSRSKKIKTAGEELRN